MKRELLRAKVLPQGQGKDVSKLSDEELRVRVAKLCGYKKRTTPETYEFMWAPGHISVLADGWWEDPKGCVMGEKCLPDYPADLNAMHEAERALIFGPRLEHSDRVFLFSNYLTGVVHPNCFASARQRAEAFVLTLDQSPDLATPRVRSVSLPKSGGLKEEKR